MNEYDKQAQDFLIKTNTKISVRYLKYDKYFVDDETERDVWEVKIEKGSREYIFTFGASIKDREELVKKVFRHPNIGYALDCLKGNQISPNDIYCARKFKELIKELSEWSDELGKKCRPSAYTILAALEAYEPAQDVDEFAETYGYTKPSQALKIFNAVTEQYNQLKMLFNDNEMEMLSEIN